MSRLTCSARVSIGWNTSREGDPLPAAPRGHTWRRIEDADEWAKTLVHIGRSMLAIPLGVALLLLIVVVVWVRSALRRGDGSVSESTDHDEASQSVES